MRTALFLLAGIALWALCLGIARLAASAGAAAIATWTFIAIWFLVAAGNMWMGVSQAGYSLGEELPIFLLIFLVPSAVAAIVKWKFL